MLPILGFVLLVQTDCPMFLHSSIPHSSLPFFSFTPLLVRSDFSHIIYVGLSVPTRARLQLNYICYRKGFNTELQFGDSECIFVMRILMTSRFVSFSQTESFYWPLGRKHSVVEAVPII